MSQFRGIAQLVERILGKDEVSSSNLDSSSSSDALKSKDFGAFFFCRSFLLCGSGTGQSGL